MKAADWRESAVACARAEALPGDKFGHQSQLLCPGRPARAGNGVRRRYSPCRHLGIFAGKAGRGRQGHPDPSAPGRSGADRGCSAGDAEILEQLGAIGALRAVVKVGRDTRYPTFSSVLTALKGAAERLSAKTHTERACRLAAPRIKTLLSLIASVQRDAGRELF